MPYFKYIPQLTPWGGYSVDVSWGYLSEEIKLYGDGTRVELCPDFQRGHVWTYAQQVAYVEFILKGGRSGKDILWNCPGWMDTFRGPMQVVDGLQRLEAVRRFMADEIPAFGYKRREYSDRLPLNARFTFHVNNLEKRSDVLRRYLDVNSGGTIHSQSELQRVRALLEAEIGQVGG